VRLWYGLSMKALMWISTITGMFGSILLAANLGYELQGFMAFVVCSAILSFYAYTKKENSLLLLQLFYIIVNTVGIVRFL
jgi:hypothetical protein